MAGLLSLGEALTSTLHKQKGDVFLAELDDNDAPTGSTLRFQYFPESINDSKRVNYASKDIIGGSLPIYQWVNSGARTISFTAVFSCDNDISDDTNLYQSLQQSGEGDRNIDIRSAVVWLRRYMYPRYSKSGTGATIPKPPRKLYLQIPSSGIGLAGMGGFGGSDSILCVMTGCDVHWLSYFPSNLPRLATVALEFSQIPQLNGSISFPSVDSFSDESASGTNKAFQGNDVGPNGGLKYSNIVFSYSLTPRK